MPGNKLNIEREKEGSTPTYPEKLFFYVQKNDGDLPLPLPCFQNMMEQTHHFQWTQYSQAQPFEMHD